MSNNYNNRFELVSSENNYAQAPAKPEDREHYRKQMIALTGSDKVPSVVYKGKTYEARTI